MTPFVDQFADQSQTLAGQWKIAVKKMFAELDPAQIRAQLSPEDMEKAFQKQIAQLGFSVLTLWLITVFDDFPTTNSYTVSLSSFRLSICEEYPTYSFQSSMFMLLLLHCGFTFVAIIIQTPLTSHHPFFSASLPSFWTRGWHQFLTLFLRSLAYEPVKRVTGSHVAAVLAVFGMSGLWHFLQVCLVSLLNMKGIAHVACVKAIPYRWEGGCHPNRSLLSLSRFRVHA